jgi:hypothetical protein
MAPCPGTKENYIIRFLNDSQGCILWYLYLTPQGNHYVLASPLWLDMLHEPDYFDPSLTEEQILKSISICALSFEEFLYRFWLENVLWYKLVWFKGQKPLTEEEQRYVEHYKRGK